MYTKHACPDIENVIPCVWQNETHAVDLSLLSNATDNHFHLYHNYDKRTTEIWYYSFCRPLTHLFQRDSNCRHGSAACKVTMKDGKVGSAVSYGIPHDPPAVYFGHEYLSLIYTNGDPCPNSQDRRSFVIKFICDQLEGEGVGNEVASESDSCAQVIEFRTDLVCDVFPGKRSIPSPEVPTPADRSSTSRGSIFAVTLAISLVLIALAMTTLAYVAGAENR